MFTKKYRRRQERKENVYEEIPEEARDMTTRSDSYFKQTDLLV